MILVTAKKKNKNSPCIASFTMSFAVSTYNKDSNKLLTIHYYAESTEHALKSMVNSAM